MNEKAFHTMSKSGAASLVIGLLVMVTGIVFGILLIVNGGKLLKGKKNITF